MMVREVGKELVRAGGVPVWVGARAGKGGGECVLVRVIARGWWQCRLGGLVRGLARKLMRC